MVVDVVVVTRIDGINVMWGEAVGVNVVMGRSELCADDGSIVLVGS